MPPQVCVLIKFLKDSLQKIPIYKFLWKLQKNPLKTRPIIPNIDTLTVRNLRRARIWDCQIWDHHPCPSASYTEALYKF